MRFAIITCLLASLLAGCFPHNAKHRRTAKWVEGGALAGGIALLAVSNTGADCTAGPAGRAEYDHCRRNSTIVGDIGLGLILGGLLGFAVTTMMSGDEKPKAALQPIASEDPEPVDPDAKPKLPTRAATRPNKH